VIATGTPEELLQRPLASPPIEVHGEDDAACAAWLGRRAEVLEVLPRAGRARVRLRAGVAPADWAVRAIAAAAGDGLQLRIATDTPPELEDVFVALLEAQEAAA
jgi:hypothetical protein